MKIRSIVLFVTVALAAQAEISKVQAKKEAKPAEVSAPITQTEQDLLPLKILKNTDIEIDSFDLEADTFLVKIVKEPAVGPNVTTWEHLLAATAGAVAPMGATKRKSDIVGKEFKLKDDLILLSDEEIARRAKK